VTFKRGHESKGTQAKQATKMTSILEEEFLHAKLLRLASLYSGLAEWNLLQDDAQQRLAENGARFAAVRLIGAKSGSKPFSGPSPAHFRSRGDRC
jgi:hypothetical protein